MKTVQIRRYELAPGAFDDFVAWWEEHFPKLRTEYGFNIEFAYGLRETDEFVWAVSAPGDRAEFERLMGPYNASEERERAFAGQPERILVHHISYVEISADAAAPAHAAKTE